ncbi:NAD(P)-binding protein [Parathielavia hyrcaniae]|uniref:NAD(P)-binding protein n=1 Tax=Parathielavia hyrcaniae TaxID=113614 RepID=A0AAN6PXF7_9PEZI|nr:NAD(P)-binding protein [Parathielavia hyrcaniae]
MPSRSKPVPFNPATDIPSLTDKIILVTGSNVGLGKQAVLEFARHNPRLIWLAARSVTKANAAVAEIKQHVPNAPIQVLELDLASLASVKKAAATVLATSPRLDILMLNAGIMFTAPDLTADGYELQFGTNHMGHALLAKLLLPLLTKTASGTPSVPKADVRVISLSSDLHARAAKPGIDYDTLHGRGEALGPLGCYYQSKLANVLWARQLAREYPQLTVAAIHPGVAQTQLMGRASGVPAVVRGLGRVMAGLGLNKTVEDAVRNQLWASVATKGVESGEYYVPIGVAGKTSAFGVDDALAKKLWDWTAKELQGYVVEA